MLRRASRLFVGGLIWAWAVAVVGAAEPAGKKEPAPAKPSSPTQETAEEGVPPEASLLFRGPLARWRTQTLGGVQLWADELCFSNWRIQRNAVTGHYRLLDGEDLRYARGSFETCMEKLEEIKTERKLPPMKGRAVIVLHGLAGYRRAMQPLADYLEENGPFTVFNVAFPSTRGDIGEHAQTLGAVVSHLDGIEEINFVGHSLGNLVIRRYLGDTSADGHKPDPRIKRFVMLAPPNHGASAALMLEDHELIAALLGGSASELGAGWSEVEKTLAVPSCEFGIIAGGRGKEKGYNPLMEGDNDGLLTVATTKLVGARDFILVPAIHQFTMLNADAQRYTLNFLLKGYFVSPEDRQPIEK
ncbi:MAG TPA: alpha/beta fold hydrolase [Pirellulales bacterium]|nr:alpha/beta fold hydrolase [Pirellulales bacterium]